VHLLQEASCLEDLQIAPDGHVRHLELAHEVRHANRANLSDALKDQGLALPSEHLPSSPASCGGDGRVTRCGAWRELQSPLASMMARPVGKSQRTRTQNTVGMRAILLTLCNRLATIGFSDLLAQNARAGITEEDLHG
jgi:hypothetical protein